MNREDTKKAIEVMQAYVDGETIEHKPNILGGHDWLGPIFECGWNWQQYEYRIKPVQVECWVNEYPPSISNRFHAHPDPEEAKKNAQEGAVRIAVHMREVEE